jgi:hypothetical protein
LGELRAGLHGHWERLGQSHHNGVAMSKIPDWIEQVDKLDRDLHDKGCPDNIRSKACADVAGILIGAEQNRKRWERRKEILEMVKQCKYRVVDAAKELEITPRAIYKAMHKESEPENSISS